MPVKYPLYRRVQDAAVAVKAKSNPRFVLLISCEHEAFPDIPQSAMPQGGEVILWDRQERKKVFTLHAEYGQSMCLEVTRHGPSHYPLTNLEHWWNNIDNISLQSETSSPPTTANTMFNVSAVAYFGVRWHDTALERGDMSPRSIPKT
jgi:hypothetical protein